MQGVTLTIALVLSVLVIMLRPKYAFVAYIVGTILSLAIESISVTKKPMTIIKKRTTKERFL